MDEILVAVDTIKHIVQYIMEKIDMNSYHQYYKLYDAYHTI